jgi:hypothetical protein
VLGLRVEVLGFRCSLSLGFCGSESRVCGLSATAPGGDADTNAAPAAPGAEALPGRQAAAFSRRTGGAPQLEHRCARGVRTASGGGRGGHPNIVQIYNASGKKKNLKCVR